MSIFKCFNKKDLLFIFIAVCLIVTQVWLDLTMPDYTAKLTELTTSGTVTSEDVWKNGGMMFLCALGSLTSFILCSFFIIQVASSFSRNVRFKMFSSVCDFSQNEMNKFSVPSLITRTTNDVDQVYRFIAMGMQMLIKAPILAVWAICKISNSSVEWTLATIICVGVIVLVVGGIVALCLPKFKKVQTLTDNLNNSSRENLTGIRVVRAFNAESYQQRKFDNANSSLTSNQLYTAKLMGVLPAFMTLCMNGLMLAIYWIGAILVQNAQTFEKATIIGNMTAFSQYAIQVVVAFMMLIMMFILLPRTIVSIKRINDVLKTSTSIQDGKGIIPTQSGQIEFKNVSFKYPSSSREVIKDINFKVDKGQTFAIIGSTGCGKTTILDLLTRSFDATSGEIFVDGENVKDYKLEDLQNKIALVSQKAILFAGDIKNNVTYGSNGELDENKLNEALLISGADFVFDMPKGVDESVAQHGSNFSGGQKQRLAIARAIYKDAEIIVFDDSFSALDYKTDFHIRENLKTKLSDKTVIIVAQRIGTIRNADCIIVLDDGQIVGKGTHDELLKSCAVYKEIALSQLSKEEL